MTVLTTVEVVDRLELDDPPDATVLTTADVVERLELDDSPDVTVLTTVEVVDRLELDDPPDVRLDCKLIFWLLAVDTASKSVDVDVSPSP